MRDKGLNQLSAGLFEGPGATEVGGIRLDQGGIEVVLADKHAQPVPQCGLPVTRTIRVSRLYGLVLFPAGGGTGRVGQPAQLLNRAETNPVGLAQGSIDGARLSDAHLSPMDQCGNIGGIGVAVTNEPLTSVSFVDDRFEDPVGRSALAVLRHKIHTDSRTTLAL